MGDIDQYLRREVGAARRVGGKSPWVDQRPGALGQCFGDLIADEISGATGHHRAERGGFVQRIAQHVLAGQGNESLDKGRVDLFIDIDALHRAAALPGIEEAAVHQVFHRMFKVGVGPDIGRVFAAELQAHAEETLRWQRVPWLLPASTEPVKFTCCTRPEAMIAPV